MDCIYLNASIYLEYIYIYICLRCFSRFMCVRMGWRSAKHLALTHYICNFQQCIFKLHNILQYNIPRPLQYSKLCSTYIEQFMGIRKKKKKRRKYILQSHIVVAQMLGQANYTVTYLMSSNCKKGEPPYICNIFFLKQQTLI